MENYIFEDESKNVEMLKGAYKKLKSFMCYDKTMLYKKKRLAELEYDRDAFESTISMIAKKLAKKDEYYFLKLIDEIDFIVLPKKMASKSKEIDIINASPDVDKVIKKVNFYIDMPVELQILDFLWTMFISKITIKYPEKLKYSAATKFKKSAFNSNEDLFEGIDYESNRFFEPYFKLYTSWRENAFDVIRSCNSEQDTVLICLDIKQFYYSVEFNFNEMKQYLNNDQRLYKFQFLSEIIEKIYFKYTNVVSKYKENIKNEKKLCILPIGAMSAFVLRELYLEEFDKLFNKKLSVKYYNRYVDDILIVLPIDDDLKNAEKESYVEKFLIKTEIAENTSVNELKINGYNNIKIQKEKVNCFLFEKNSENILLEIYEKIIDTNSSEKNMLPDVDILSSSFSQHAYKIQNLDVSSKIRDIGFLQNNNYNTIKYITSLQRLIKNTNISSEKNQDISKCLNDIVKFYQGSQCIENTNIWRNVFELFLLCNEKKLARDLYKNINKEIDKITLMNLEDYEVAEESKNVLLEKMKKDLHNRLEVAVALAVSLNEELVKSTDIKTMSEQFRTTNFLNHTLVAYPLLNYSKYNVGNLTEYNLSYLFEKYSENVFESDEFKLNFSPRFINAIEFYIARFLESYHNAEIVQYDPNTVLDEFFKYNSMDKYINSHINYKPVFHEKSHHHLCTINNSMNLNPRIGLVNTKISGKDVLRYLDSPEDAISLEKKARVFKILNEAKYEKVSFLAFPEFYLPIQWLVDISIFSIKSQISVISGLHYLRFKSNVYNNVFSITPCKLNRSFLFGFLQIREKNFYAPEEQLLLAQKGFECTDKDIPNYFITDNSLFKYSIMLCYEFTDIFSRANFKGELELLFIPQLNRDTNYFSAIVESAARDLHAFVVQSNTSLFGDSRITAPYKTLYKNILQVKGGDNDVVLVATIEINKLLDFRKKYNPSLKSTINKCRNCRHTPEQCDKCVFEFKDKIIKGTPPNFFI